MIPFSSISIAFFLAIASAQASPCDAEKSVHTVLKNLSATSHATLVRKSAVISVPGEQKIGGVLLEPRQPFGDLKDGLYCFVGDGAGNLAYANQIAEHADRDGHFVVSQASLNSKLALYLGPEFRPVTAGNFEINAGRVTEVNLRSNVYEIPPVKEIMTRQMLEGRGLKIEELTRGMQSKTHEVQALENIELLNAEAYHRLRRHAPANEGILALENLQKKLSDAYPKRRSPGKFDAKTFLNSFESRITNYGKKIKLSKTLTSEEAVDLQEVVFILEKMQNQQEKYFALESVIKRYGPKKTVQLIESIPDFEGSMRSFSVQSEKMKMQDKAARALNRKGR